jgi:hypothetical protein
MYKDKNGILISDDKGLHEKAKAVEMQVIPMMILLPNL